MPPTTFQEKAMKSHLLEYLDQHRRLEESVAPKKIEKSDVKSRLQVLVWLCMPVPLLLLFPGVCLAEETAGESFQHEPGGDGGGSRGRGHRR